MKNIRKIKSGFKLPSGRIIEGYINNNGCVECIQSLDKNSYPRITINRKQCMLTHLIWEAYHKHPVPKGIFVLHNCDNPACINPAHLKLGTQADNIRDRVERGRSAIGEKNGRSKLTEDNVRYIKRHPEISGMQLAKKFGVHKKVIYKIRNGVNWGHVK